MAHFKFTLQHIVDNIDNYHEINNYNLERVNRKKYLYAHRNVCNNIFQRFKLNKYYSCVYTGDDVDVYISFHVIKHINAEELDTFLKTQVYEYEDIMQKNKSNKPLANGSKSWLGKYIE